MTTPTRSQSVGLGKGMKRPSNVGVRSAGPRSKKARQNGWSVVFLDESGFMFQPVVRRTWAPRAKTPIQYSWDRHDRLSVISAITIAPLRCRMGLYLQIHNGNVRWKEVIAFLTMLHRHLRPSSSSWWTGSTLTARR